MSDIKKIHAAIIASPYKRRNQHILVVRAGIVGSFRYFVVSYQALLCNSEFAPTVIVEIDPQYQLLLLSCAFSGLTFPEPESFVGEVFFGKEIYTKCNIDYVIHPKPTIEHKAQPLLEYSFSANTCLNSKSIHTAASVISVHRHNFDIAHRFFSGDKFPQQDTALEDYF